MMGELVDRPVLGHYRVLRPLAVGGMGVIYLGRSEGAAGFAKPVVIKRIEPRYMQEDDEAETYFVNEAKILSRMRHPEIVSVVDFGREPDGAYAMILEYVHGFTLSQWLGFHRKKNERFPAEEAIYVVRRILGALDYAHTSRAPDGTPSGVVHRDVTPSNVLIDVDGHIKLADFGIASIRSNDEAPRARKLRGKLSYLAPELFGGAAPSISSDVYSAALVLHELLLGTNEFRASSTVRAFARVSRHVPTRIATKREDVLPSLDDILARALAKTPERRYPSADALAEALRLVQRASDAEIERSLKRRVRVDFEGELPELLGVERLEVRAAALNESRESEPLPARAAPRGRRGGAFRKAAVALLLLMVGSGAFARFAAGERPMETRPSVALKRDEPIATVDAPRSEALPVLTAPSAESPPAAVPEVAPAPAETATRRSRPPRQDDLLTRAFAWHRPAIKACFEKGRVALARTERVAIVFHTAESGDVERVRLHPARFARTAVGRCMLGVARNARFGPRERESSFAIAVTAP